MLDFIWKSQPNEIDANTKTGESLSRTNIKTCILPFGQLWVGSTVFLNAVKVPVGIARYTVLFNNLIIQHNLATEAEAITAAETWYKNEAGHIIQSKNPATPVSKEIATNVNA